MITMAMDIQNISAKSLAEQAKISMSAFQCKMRRLNQKGDERSFDLNECYRILDILKIQRSKIYEYFPD